jgi:hypothetical protein
VAQWRFDHYEQAAGLLNDMYVYFLYVGKWKEYTPEDIVERKRDVDKILYSSGPVFSDNLIARYNDLIAEMFQPFQGWGQDARLRTTVQHRKQAAVEGHLTWNSAWNANFTGEDNIGRIRVAYTALTKQLAIDLDLLPDK